MRKTDKGLYVPKNVQKIIGNPEKITYRSGWERQVFMEFDSNPAIIAWGSEQVEIPYKHPLKNRWTVYIPDLIVVYMDKHGTKHVEMMEIKPLKETPGYRRKSVRTGKEMKLTEHDQIAQAVNAYKWAAAQHYCKKRGWAFRVLTEENLFGRVK
jgi:hypothetical protein